MITLKNVSKTFIKNNENIKALEDFSYEFNEGKLYAITGHSGSGKSTLLSIIGLIQKSDNGTYLFNGADVTKFNNNEMSEFRMKNIGFVFQDYMLDPYLDALENVMLPLLNNKDVKASDRESLAKSLLDKVGLKERYNHFPKELSGGEQQRVAIARALVNDPKIILADEPTGNLDVDNEKIILDIFKDLVNDNKCVIMVTHNNDLVSYADFNIILNKGRIGE